MRHSAHEYDDLAHQQIDKSYKMNEPTSIRLTIQVAQVYATLALAAATLETVRSGPEYS